MSSSRIVITGLSAISSLGTTLEEQAAALAADTPPVVSALKTTEFHEFANDVACYRVESMNPEDILGKKGLRLKDWSTKLLLCAAELAFKERLEAYEPEEIPGIAVGTAFGSVQSIGDFLSDSIVNGVNNVNPQLFANTVINAATGNVNIRFLMRSLSSTISTGFNSGLDAIIYSHDYIKRGYIDAIVAGGLDEVSYYGLLGLLRSGVYSRSTHAQPFGCSRDGLVAGEGCGLVFIESEEVARKRGSTIIAEIAGVGQSFDSAPGRGFNPSGEGARKAIELACEMAGVGADDVDMVVASANGSPEGDAMEARVLKELFPTAPVAAYKARTGECYGASAALNVVYGLLDMQNSRISGTGTHYNVDSGIDVVQTTRSLKRCDTIVVNAFSCDGNCSAIVLKRYQ